MPDLILHHYDISPYAEKARLMLGFKGLAWKSVVIPMVMPKPDLTCLTGGYRKTPVLQIGADVYCDTKTIARALERIQPEPTLYPPHTQASEPALSVLGDTMFLQAIAILLGAGFLPSDLIEDRKKLFGEHFDAETMRRVVPAKREQLWSALAGLDAQLSDGRAFVLGSAASLADFSVHNPVSILPLVPLTARLLDPFRHLDAWRGRMAAFGHGQRTEMSAEEAIRAARDAEPARAGRVDPNEPNGYRAGDRVTVVPEDYGRDAVTGELVASDPFEVAIRRTDERVGEVVVHFPRQGYLMTPCA